MHVLHREQPETSLMRLDLSRLFFLEVEVFVSATNHGGFIIIDTTFVGHCLDDGYQLALVFLCLFEVMLK